MKQYAIDCTKNPRYTGYVGKAPFYFTTHYIEDAKLWKTRDGAERWLEQRSGFTGRIVEVEMRRGVRGGQIPALAA